MTAIERLNAYVAGVLDGSIVVSAYVRKAVARHAADLNRKRWTVGKKRRSFTFDVERAERVVGFIECLKHSTGEFADKPFVLEPWQVFIVGSLFGWRDKHGYRRFRDAFITIGRGNGKSPLAAAILLVLFLFDDPREARAEIKVAATEREQAYIVWSECQRLIEGQPALKAITQIYGGRGRSSLNNTILDLRTHGTLVPLGKEAATKDGFNLHGYVIDEIHAFKEEHRELLEKLATAMGKRRQPLAVTITTAGSERSTIWKEQIDASRRVLDGVVKDPAHFGFIAELDSGDDVHDPANWIKANPNLGISVKPEYMHRESEQARFSPKKLNTFLRYHCNQLVTSTTKAFSADVWARGKRQLPDLTGQPCALGLDLGWRNDLASVSACWDLGENTYAAKSWSFLPDECEHDLTRPPWSNWIANGSLTITEGNTTDVKAIIELILSIREQYGIIVVEADGNNARSILTDLINDHGIECHEFHQTCFNYNGPVTQLTDRVTEGNLIHGGDSLLAWAADNVVWRHDTRGYAMPCKNKSAEKIDPIVALLMAFDRLLYDDKQRSVYEDHGLRSL